MRVTKSGTMPVLGVCMITVDIFHCAESTALSGAGRHFEQLLSGFFMLSFAKTSFVLLTLSALVATAADPIRDLQTQAIENKRAEFAHWGTTPDNYMQWGSHSNRLIPVYAFGTKDAGEGIDLKGYFGAASPYRSEELVQKLYHRVPLGTVNPEAMAMDQTNVADIQRYALVAGKKHIILVVFDGMDWQTTWAAGIYNKKSVAYQDGRGTGLHFLDYTAGGTTQYGYMVTSPYSDNLDVDTNLQTVKVPEKLYYGGYSLALGGQFPWSTPSEVEYPIGTASDDLYSHTYTDSSSSATSMTAGIKTYNSAVNVDHEGRQVETVAHLAQRQGYRVGVVTSVPISHATPAAAYAHNVHRDDYQDLTRDMLGIKSISHPDEPLPGVDVLMGAGWGESRPKDAKQGDNFVPGNAYLADADFMAIDARMGGRYVVAQREAGVSGAEALAGATDQAIESGKRLFAYYGVKGGHMPFRTADGDYNPTIGRGKDAEKYTDADVRENPILADFTAQTLRYLSQDDKPFWLMVEAGDVDWANHDNNIDNSIGAVISGDMAVKTITDWVDANSNWKETVLIVTADHGHYLVIDKPEALAPSEQ